MTTLIVEVPSGQQHRIEYWANYTVFTIRRMVSHMMDSTGRIHFDKNGCVKEFGCIHEGYIKLYFEGRELKPTENLDELGIQNGSIVKVRIMPENERPKRESIYDFTRDMETQIADNERKELEDLIDHRIQLHLDKTIIYSVVRFNEEVKRIDELTEKIEKMQELRKTLLASIGVHPYTPLPISTDLP